MTPTGPNPERVELLAEQVSSRRPKPAKPVIVELSDGQTYKIEAFQGGVNVTGELTPKQQKAAYEKVLQLFQQATGKDQFKSAKILLEGESGTLTPKNLRKQNVRIVGEPKFTYEEGGRVVPSTLPESTEAVVFDRLEELGTSYRERAAVSSAAPAAVPAAPIEYEHIPKDDRVDIVKGRTHRTVAPLPPLPQGNACDALADQFMTIPNSGHTNWHGQPIATIIPTILYEIPAYMSRIITGTNKEQWIDANIKDMVESLSQARLSDRALFQNALTRLNAARQTEGKSELTIGAMDALFTGPNLLNPSPDEKDIFANLYQKYILNPQCKFVGNTFFKLFVELHEKNDKQDYFQIVLIREDANGKRTATSFPEGREIETDRCAFIHIDANGNCSSFDRAANAAAKLSDLNTKKRISSTLQTTRIPKIPPSPIKTLNDLEAGARNLDMSIAYQMLQQQNPKMTHEQILESEDLVELANELREQAAKLILEEDSDEFYIGLKDSILGIPIFGGAARGYSDEQRLHSNESLLKLRTDPLLVAIDEILAGEPLHWEDEQKILLKRFYSDYIKQKPDPAENTDRGKYVNKLDKAFLHVLLKFHSLTMPPIKCAIVRDNIIAETYEGTRVNSELKTDGWLFLKDNGTNQYEPINLKDPGTRKEIKSLIDQKKNKELRDFLNDLPTDDPYVVKRKFTVIKNKYPEAYKAFCRLASKFFSHSKGGKPTPPDEAFGDKTIKELSEQNLKNFLQSFSRTDINNSIRGIATLTPPSPPAPSPSVSAAPPLATTPAKFATIEVDASGQCFDKSIAYQMMKKEGIQDPLSSVNKGDLDLRARKLRTDVAKYIREKGELNKDDLFMAALTASIYSMAEKLPEGEKLPREIQEILDKDRSAIISPKLTFSAKEAKILRTFYAEQIKNPSTYLDAGFIYILPKVVSKINIVIMRGDTIHETIPTKEPLNINDTIFLNYNGVNHYKAIDSDNEDNKTNIAKVFVKDLMNYVKLPGSNAQDIKEKLQQMKLQNLQAYGIITRQIYEHDVAEWERTHYLDKPGTKSLTHEGKIYQPQDYGEFRIDTASEDELKTLLKHLTKKIDDVATLREAPRS